MNDGESHLVGDDLGSKPLPITNAADNDANRSNDLALGNNLDKEMLKFKDAVGRKFTFPFNMVNTWQGMEEVIKQAFLQVDVLGPHVQNGHYDIIGPNGDIILPSIWERVVEPGWTVTMAMWPMPKPPLGPLPPRSKPAPRPRAPVPDQVNVPARSTQKHGLVACDEKCHEL
ncbi:hypothetical protein B0I35DRAFT_412308 [Stachybotrys elegans]|uniref:Ubiquitin-like domain-containing protein n=1 Tax=Stachybotrys elegans TaxID=80388 RepID=A0A8K0SQ46_9HYPO|nr:hypothetical protein B0I35DRAFT_412308 [Stachybotrys elegans]